MVNLKDSLNDKSKTVTLTPNEIAFLQHLNQYMQLKLTEIQDHLASVYLGGIAIDKHGMDPEKTYTFDFHPEKPTDNLTITEVELPKE